MFPYLKDARQSSGSGAVAALTWYTFRESSSFFIPSCGNLEVIPLPVEHGRRKLAGGDYGAYLCMGFRMGDFSYISDASSVPEDTRRKIQGTRVLVLDALRERPHPSHMNFQEVRNGLTIATDGVGERIRQEHCSAARDYIFYRIFTWYWSLLDWERFENMVGVWRHWCCPCVWWIESQSSAVAIVLITMPPFQ